MPTDPTLPPAPDNRGYQLALVLSGGGARGFAHVGVVQVFEQLALPIDLVVGVSMGSIVGAGYAAGLSSARMSELASRVQVHHVFRPRVRRLYCHTAIHGSHR